MKLLLAALLTAGCTHAKPEPPTSDPTQLAFTAYQETIKRLSGFLESGFVVSHGFDEHRGDSLIWTGVAMSALPCTDGDPLETALAGMLKELNGGIYRHPAIKDQKPSLDGALGLWRGIAHRMKHCNSKVFDPLLPMHIRWLREHKDIVPPPFDYIPDMLSGGQATAERDVLETEIGVWADAVLAAKASCYRVHLGYLALTTIEEMGQPVTGVARNTYCSATQTMKLALTDHWCGRPGLKEFLDNFQYNVFEYQPQRCLAWEEPDGNGYETPAVDRLRGLTDYYHF